jgi:hypothetical protein
MVNRLRVLTLCGATVGDEDLWAADNITLSESYLQTVIVYLQYYRVVILTKVEKNASAFCDPTQLARLSENHEPTRLTS